MLLSRVRSNSAVMAGQPEQAAARRPRRIPLRRWHRWCGLAVLVFFVLAALSGMALVYKQPLVRWLMTDQASLPAHYSVEQLAAELQRLPQHPLYRPGDSFKAPNVDEPYWTLRHGGGTVDLLAVGSLEAYQQHRWLLEAMAWIRELHVDLLAGVTGEVVMLVTGIGCLFLTASGLWLWWPGRSSFRWRWVFPWHWRSAWLLHYHRHSGVVAAAMLLIILLTSSIMLWQKLTNAFTAPTPVARVAPPDLAGLDLAAAVLQTAQTLPDSWPTYIRISGGDAPVARIRVRFAGEWHANGRSSVSIDLSTGQITRLKRSDQAPPLRRALNQLYPLHSGYGMPAVYALLVFVAGLAGVWLSISGGWSYWRRRQRGRARQ